MNAKLTRINFILLECCLIGFALTYPYTVKYANGGILAICLFALLSNTLPEKWVKLKETKGLWLLPIFFTILSIGVLYSDDLKHGFDIFERSIAFFLFPVVLGTGATIPRETWMRVIWVTILNTIAAAVYCIIQNVYFFKDNKIPFNRFFDWEYSYEHLSHFINFHPTYFSILALLCIFFLVFVVSYSAWWQKVVNVLLILFLFMFLILLGSKIVTLVLFVFSNAALLVYLRMKRKIALVFGYIFLNIVMLTVAFNTHVIYWRFRMAYETIKNTLNGTEMSDYRILHWKCALEAIVQKPVFGWGTGDSERRLDSCYQQLGMNELTGYNTHNQFLEAWLKIGIPGLVIVAFCLLVPLVVSIRNRHYLFISIFAMYLIISFTECIFSVQKGIALYSLITSIYFGHICISKSRAKGAPV